MSDVTKTSSLTLQVREGEAPSYFNAVEAAVLVELVEGLLASTQKAGARGVRPDDLGVMATYRKQVRCCRRKGKRLFTRTAQLQCHSLKRPFTTHK